MPSKCFIGNRFWLIEEVFRHFPLFNLEEQIDNNENYNHIFEAKTKSAGYRSTRYSFPRPNDYKQILAPNSRSLQTPATCPQLFGLEETHSHNQRYKF